LRERRALAMAMRAVKKIFMLKVETSSRPRDRRMAAAGQKFLPSVLMAARLYRNATIVIVALDATTGIARETAR
jgi:hypothetical protein